MDRDLERSNDPLGRPIGDEVVSGQRPGRSIESGRTDMPNEDLEIGDEGATPDAHAPSM